MIVTTRNGKTECRFEDFAAVEPAIVAIRDAFRSGAINADEVYVKVRALFGPYRFGKDFDKFFEGRTTDYGYSRGYPITAPEEWDAHVEKNKLHKLYYSHEVVAGCITQEAK